MYSEICLYFFKLDFFFSVIVSIAQINESHFWVCVCLPNSNVLNRLVWFLDTSQ